MICWTCKTSGEIAYTDDLGRAFCVECVADRPLPVTAQAMAFLAVTIPYHPGDRVKCWTGGKQYGIYRGVGHVVRMSTSLEDLATPVVPMFLVAMDEKAADDVPDEIFFTEVCLEPVR